MVKQIIKEFLNSWKQGVIEIGKAYQEGADFKTLAEVFIERHYAFSEEDILFKPTFTAEKVFRNTKADAISYFVEGDISEDKGFALKLYKWFGIYISIFFKPSTKTSYWKQYIHK